jgi:hypothetical protein
MKIPITVNKKSDILESIDNSIYANNFSHYIANNYESMEDALNHKDLDLQINKISER